MKKTRVLFVLACALMACAPAWAGSQPESQPGSQPESWSTAPLRLPDTPFVYSTDGSSIADALQAFSDAAHIPVQMPLPLPGRVVGRFDLSPRQFLDTLSSSYGLVWYYDGAALQVEPANEERTLAIRLNYATAGAVLAVLKRDGFDDPRFPLDADAGANTITATGPSRYILRVGEAVRRLEDSARGQVATAVKVVTLHVAQAADQTSVVGGQTVTTLGVASRLAQQLRQGVRLDGTSPALVEYDPPLPVFEADAQTNSIVIRDRPGRLAGDTLLVAQLDRAPELISIEAQVFDVDADAYATLAPDVPPDAQSAQSGGGAAAGRPGVVVEPDAARVLLARLDALERAGRAHRRIDRTALTFDHSPTVIDRREAQLAGLAQSDARDPRETGDAGDVSLDVTPSAAGNPAGSRIELLAKVDDGAMAAGHHRDGDTAGDKQAAARPAAKASVEPVAAHAADAPGHAPAADDIPDPASSMLDLDAFEMDDANDGMDRTDGKGKAGHTAGHADGAADTHWADVRATLSPGDGLVVVNPPSRDALVPGTRRLVLLVPRVAS
ncbi:hypothetical protein CY652_21025 [Burkholderia sp. WAC0059]|uniref:secretin N-terminal domain-containing protein n=1 Tax=Burkholderia sp. WAC0059 TaxID=2066022 RepID=UPI000C7F5D94|nr:secretin N-terminal domain-containing protein [Burkholderia sp. WAC0059]PLZ00480.1 hypothetical protein CY652_21025 [Burkholderia sp. WAC0059]